MGIGNTISKGFSRSRAIIPGIIAYIVVYGILAVVTTSIFGSGTAISNLLAIVFLVVAFFPAKRIGMLIGYRNLPKCPNCGTAAHGRPNSRECVSTQDIYTVVENTRYNGRGDAIGTEEQHVPGARYTYRCTYTCPSCHEAFYVDECEDVPYV